MLSETERISKDIAEIMKTVYDETGIESLVYVSKINPSGITVID
jgi:homoserine kinase